MSDGEIIYRINRNQVASGKMSLKQKAWIERWGERERYVYRINRNQVASGKMSLKQKGGAQWGDRIPY